MLVEARDEALTYPRAIKAEKSRLVLDWLLEFRFASFDLLAKRIGQSTVNANRFFNSLLDDGLIQIVQNVHTGQARYAMLTVSGASFLEGHGRSIDHAVTRVHGIGRFSTIVHDLAVQWAVLRRLEISKEVIAERRMPFGKNHDRPDALFRTVHGWRGLEYERWRKDTRRIYISFVNHIVNIQAGHYDGVYYCFDGLADMKHYQKLFGEREWPLFERKSRSGYIKTLPGVFRPDDIKGARELFAFCHEPIAE